MTQNSLVSNESNTTVNFSILDEDKDFEMENEDEQPNLKKRKSEPTDTTDVNNNTNLYPFLSYQSSLSIPFPSSINYISNQSQQPSPPSQ